MRRKKKSNKKAIIISLFVAGIMVFSIFAIVIDRYAPSELTYNKYSFVVSNNQYVTKIAGKSLKFYYFPSDLENINVSESAKEKLKNAEFIGILFNPDADENNLVYIDTLRFELPQLLKQQTFDIMTKNSSKYSLQIATCENSTGLMPFIYFNVSENVSVSEYKDCIVLNGNRTGLVMARDRVIYSYYGIMN